MVQKDVSKQIKPFSIRITAVLFILSSVILRFVVLHVYCDNSYRLVMISIKRPNDLRVHLFL